MTSETSPARCLRGMLAPGGEGSPTGDSSMIFEPTRKHDAVTTTAARASAGSPIDGGASQTGVITRRRVTFSASRTSGAVVRPEPPAHDGDLRVSRPAPSRPAASHGWPDRPVRRSSAGSGGLVPGVFRAPLVDGGATGEAVHRAGERPALLESRPAGVGDRAATGVGESRVRPAIGPDKMAGSIPAGSTEAQRRPEAKGSTGDRVPGEPERSGVRSSGVGAHPRQGHAPQGGPDRWVLGARASTFTPGEHAGSPTGGAPPRSTTCTTRSPMSP